METIIALLEATVVKYKKGSVADGDQMLRTATRLRRESQKALSLIPEKPAPKTS